jgi:hypothetical protein
LNGFTAGTPTNSQICLTGSFGTSLVYSVVLTDTATLATASVTGTASGNLLVVTVPSSFYPLTSATQPDPVTIDITPPTNSGASSQSGSFQTNPALTDGGPIFVSAVNQPVNWTMYTGGTGTVTDAFGNGTYPAGMQAFPAYGQTWSGTPTQNGVFTFSMSATDGWNDQVVPTLSVYIVPKPQILRLSPNSTVAGSPALTIDINGPATNGPIGFVAPINIQSTPEPGSSVLWTNGTLTTTLTPSNYTNTDLTVTIPANLLATTGQHAIVVVNPGPAGSNGVIFTVNPSITGLSTYSRTAGAPAFPLGITGTGFVSGSVVQVNGTQLPTTFVNSTNLTTTFPSISAPTTVLINVLNPDGTATPVPQSLAVVLPPTVSSLKPASVNAGSPSFALTVSGAYFQSSNTVYFNSIPLPTTLVPNQQNNTLIANVPASAITTAGIVPVTVGTADGYYTTGLPFTIVSTGPPPLQLSSFSPLPAGTVNAPYNFTFTATYGAGGYTFSVTSGTLPAGLQLSGAGILSGTPTAYGASQFTVQVADSAQATVSRIFTLNIAPAPLTLTTGPLANTQVNAPVNVQFAGNGGIPPYTFVEFGTLPTGVQFSSSGLLSGTPTKSGAFPFQVFLDDTTGAYTSKNYTLSVAIPGLLITPPSPLPAGQINVPYSTQMTATGGVGAPYTWYASGLPNGLTMASNTGLIAGIPRAAGTFNIGVTVSDFSGATNTQTYALTIAPATVSVTNGTLPNGAVGSSYNASVTASGGQGAFTFTATGLPPGVTLSSAGALSGTPTTAGAYSIVVTATDAAGNTASGTFRVTITAALVVTASTIPSVVLGNAISSVQLTATGGTPPYQWQSANLPPGVSLALNGALSGTPSAVGTFAFTVYAVDANGALSSGKESLTVTLPTAPAATIGGLPASTAPTTQQFLQVSLANPYPATVTANLTLTFAPTSGADDPAVQFSTGGRTAQITIPAGYTSGLTNVGVQTGTVAGTITITAQLLAGTTNVTPTPAPSQTIQVTAGAPVITKLTATRTSTGFTVSVTGFASNRGVDGGTFQFSASEGSSLQTTQLSTTDTSLFSTWYGTSTSAPFGSQFTLSQPFTVSGTNSAVLSVTVTLTNALGTSPAATAILQ